MFTITVTSTMLVLSVTTSILYNIHISSALYRHTHPNDPHACRKAHQIDGKTVYFCCDGYIKDVDADVTSPCQECPDGKHGENCNGTCSCENAGTCDTATGVCVCPQGYYGKHCHLPCNCVNGASCDMLDGSCICPNGNHGFFCQNICDCPKETTCDSKTGKCNCKEGYFGSPPSTACRRCNCTENAMCDTLDGHCVCKSGYYGPRCDKQCSCYNGASCSASDPGECKCSRGWSGRSCAQCDSDILKENNRPYCEDKCFRCYNGHECKPSDGNCLCLPGWHGNWCDKKCDEGYYGENCSSDCLCLNGGSCNHVTGVCKCTPGFHGKYCEQPCPDNCLDCKDEGCLSCTPGWTGMHCETPCSSGFYGDSCRKTCECFCSDACNHVNGSCPSYVRCDNTCRCKNGIYCTENQKKCECSPGWSGQDCNKLAATQVHDGENNYTSTPDNKIYDIPKQSINGDRSAYVYLGIFPPLLLVILIPISLVVYFRRCSRGPDRDRRSIDESQGNIAGLHTTSTTISETQPSASFHEGSERQSTFPIYATINKSARYQRKNSDAREEEKVTFLEGPLGDFKTQPNDQQTTQDKASSCATNVNNYDNIDRTGKGYKQRHLTRQAYYEELKPLSTGDNDRRLEFT